MKGSSQNDSIGYFETFSPTPSSAAIRVFVVVLCRSIDVDQFDADQALVQPGINVAVYMENAAWLQRFD